MFLWLQINFVQCTNVQFEPNTDKKCTLAYVNILVDSYIMFCMLWFVFIFLHITFYRTIHHIKLFYDDIFLVIYGCVFFFSFEIFFKSFFERSDIIFWANNSIFLPKIRALLHLISPVSQNECELIYIYLVPCFLSYLNHQTNNCHWS